MAMRGDALSEHILYTAKTVFLEMGFERASMDVIAERAGTSKRTLYSHFESKEKLYFAIIELVRKMFLSRLYTPDHYSEDVVNALTIYCGRFLEHLSYSWTVRMCRLSISVVERFPEGSAGYFDVIFGATTERLANYLAEQFSISEQDSRRAADDLLGRVIYPRFPRALFGLDAPIETIDDRAISSILDVAAVREIVVDVVEHLKNTRRD